MNRQSIEEIPKPAVTRNADSPNDHRLLSKSGESGDLPACIIANVARLVNCPIISTDAEVSANGSSHLLILVLVPDLIPDLCSLYDDSSRFDHLDLGDIPIKSHNGSIYWLID